MTMTGNHAPMLRSRSKDDWDGNARSVDLPLAQVIGEHLAAEAPDTFVSPGDAVDFYDWGGALDVTPIWEDEFDLGAGDGCTDTCDCDACILPGILPGESYKAYYERTTFDGIATEAVMGTVFDPDDLGWGFSVVDGFSIRRPGQSYAKAF